MNIYKCTPRQVRSFMIDIIEAGLVPYIQSSPGMGKSSIVASVAKDFKLKLIDHRLSTSQPEDLSGYPDLKSGRAKFVPFDIFPTEDIAIPTNYDGWMIFFDEFNAASKSVQAASYKTILDKMVGQFKLHKNVAMAAAGNLASDRAIVNPLSTAMQSRVIHLEMELSHDEWMQDVALKQNYDSRIIAYLNFKKDDLMDFRPEHEEKTFCCPRTWEFMNRLIKNKPITDDKTSMYAGVITSGVAASFVQFTKVFAELTTIDEIMRDPHGCRLPVDTATKWAVVSHLMSVVDDKNFKEIAQFTSRLDISFRILFIRGALVRNPNFRSHSEFIAQLSTLAKYLHE
jgi:hypothetical protein